VARGSIMQTEMLLATAGIYSTLCLKKKGPTLKQYSSKLYGLILMIFGGNIQKSLE